VFFLSYYEIFELCIGVVSVVSYGDQSGLLVLLKRNGYALLAMCYLCMGLLDEMAVKLLDHVLGF
jgi:hypothetical protein